jgi:hypothetical protein
MPPAKVQVSELPEPSATLPAPPSRSAATLDGYGRGEQRLLEGASMGDKSPKKDNAKKPAHSLKEKRAAKRDKQREERGLGSR